MNGANSAHTIIVKQSKEKSKSLKACHKRCAERTLKVLEKNGGIFIKLGQHLVSSEAIEVWTCSDDDRVL